MQGKGGGVKTKQGRRQEAKRGLFCHLKKKILPEKKVKAAGAKADSLEALEGTVEKKTSGTID